MINLLPQEEKNRILRERKDKLYMILCSIVVFFVISNILILGVSAIYIKSEVFIQKEKLLKIEKDFEDSGVSNFQKEISDFNGSLAKVGKIYQNKLYFSEIIGKISEILPSGVYLKNLSITESKKEENQVFKATIQGFSATRENLFELKKNFDKSSFFDEVDFPVGNWVKLNNIDFTITFSINSKQK